MPYKERVVRTFYTAVDVVDFLVESGSTLVFEYDTGTFLIQDHGLESLELRVDEDSVDPDEVFQELATRLKFKIYTT